MKILAILVLGVLLVSLTGVAAQYFTTDAGVDVEANSASADGSAEADVSANAEANTAASGSASAGGEGQSNVAALLRVELVNEGNYTGPFGLLVKVRAMEGGFQEINVRNVSAKSSLDLAVQTEADNEVKLKARLSNGRDVEIKIMPDTASETALARLRLKVCSPENNCTIELKEVGAEANAKAVYEVKANQKVKILGLFPANARSEAQIDAETGAVIKSKNPWWTAISTSTSVSASASAK